MAARRIVCASARPYNGSGDGSQKKKRDRYRTRTGTGTTGTGMVMIDVICNFSVTYTVSVVHLHPCRRARLLVVSGFARSDAPHHPPSTASNATVLGEGFSSSDGGTFARA